MSEFKAAMLCCVNISVSSTFVPASKAFERTFKLATVQKGVN